MYILTLLQNKLLPLMCIHCLCPYCEYSNSLILTEKNFFLCWRSDGINTETSRQMLSFSDQEWMRCRSRAAKNHVVARFKVTETDRESSRDGQWDHGAGHGRYRRMFCELVSAQAMGGLVSMQGPCYRGQVKVCNPARHIRNST